MSIRWDKWGKDFLFSLMRHCGTAGMAWMGTNTITGQPAWSTFKTLPLAIMFGAVLPTLWTKLQNPPKDEDDTSDPVNKPV